jgi:cellulose synthase/poly-beta-1,6-N-acetylglucosamine synthase-like glycosyltransferase
LDYPADLLRVVVASDGSSDATAEIVAGFKDPMVRLLHYDERRGKASLLNSAIADTRQEKGTDAFCRNGPEGAAHKSRQSPYPENGGEILVLSDANTEYQPDAIRKLVRWFADPKVGAVCGRLVLTDPVGGKNVDSLYWRYETFLKRCEGSLGALLGANGAIYAVRRSMYVPIPDNTIVDDFVIPLLSKLRHKGRIIYDPEAIGIEETPPTIGNEFHRRVRIGTGAYQSVPILWRLLSPQYGWTAFAFFSHKIMRWMVPFCLLGMLVANVLLLDQPLFQAILALQVGVYAISLAGGHLRGRGAAIKVARALAMFVGMNMALLVGFWRWVSSPQTGAWHRTSRDGSPKAGEVAALGRSGILSK